MTLYLSPEHVLAAVAADHCDGCQAPLIGGVACGRCWERAIRDDERFALENELPRELSSDRSDVDEIAVERAVNGFTVDLTPVERAAAIDRLRTAGRTLVEIARLVGSSPQTIQRQLHTASSPRPPVAMPRRAEELVSDCGSVPVLPLVGFGVFLAVGSLVPALPLIALAAIVLFGLAGLVVASVVVGRRERRANSVFAARFAEGQRLLVERVRYETALRDQQAGIGGGWDER